MPGSAIAKDFGVKLALTKTATDGSLATGWASIVTDANGRPIMDYDGSIIPVDDLERATMYAFGKYGGTGKLGDMHERTGAGDVVESIVLTKAKREALNLGAGPEGWAVTLKINDPQVREDVRSGRKIELSIAGTAEVEPIEVGKRVSGATGPHMLRNLTLKSSEFLSVVDAGASGDANHRPSIVLVKRKEIPVPKTKTTKSSKQPIEILKAKLSDNEIAKAGAWLTLEKLGELPENAQASLDAIKGKLDDPEWALLELLLSQSGVNCAPGAKGGKADEGSPAEEAAETPAEETAEQKAMMGKIAKAAPEVAEMIKGLSAEVEKARKQTAEAQKKADEAQKQAAEARKVADTEIEKRRDAEIVELAKSMPHLPGKPEDLAKELKSAEAFMEPVLYKAHVDRLRSIDALLKTNKLLKADGVADPAPDGSSRATLDKLAEELRKTTDGARLSKEQAFAKVCRQNRELFKRYRDENHPTA